MVKITSRDQSVNGYGDRERKKKKKVFVSWDVENI